MNGQKQSIFRQTGSSCFIFADGIGKPVIFCPKGVSKLKKILFGLIGLVMITATVAGGAVALFSSQATLENVSFASGNATLQIWDGDSYETTWNSTINLANMYPGYTSPAYNMWLKNASTAPVSLSVAMQLTNGGGNWPNGLENVVEALVANSDESANTG